MLHRRVGITLLVTFVMVVVTLLWVTDSFASGYTLTHGEAKRATVVAAEKKYAAWDVDVVKTVCAPQFINYRSDWRKYEWHRWKCGWVGLDGDLDVAYGFFRITGHSDGTFGYLSINGGIRWE